jgi:anti-sigma factor RsiW
VGERLKDQTPSAGDESRVQEYLAGRLDPAEAELFEERMFTDDALAAEVQRALEIRAATLPASVERRTARPPRRAWLALAAAAGAAVIAVGINYLQQPPVPAVFRGVEQRMGLEVEVDGGALRARWQPIADAAGYELQVLASDGRVLRSLEADGPAATLDLGAPADSASAPAFIEVSALDELGQTLRRSERLALPDR